jgi:YVTN family beta-propeller protein
MTLKGIALLALVAAFAVIAAAQTKPVLAALNKGDSNLVLIDPEAMKVLAKIPVGDSPHEVIFSSDGKLAFVANYGAQNPGSTLSVIDVATAKELRRVDLTPLIRPHGLHFLTGKLYFTAEANRLIARYDPVANKVDWMMGTGQSGSHMIVGMPDGKRFYTANIGSDSVTSFEFPPSAPSKVTHIPVGKQPEAVDLSPDGKEVWLGLNADGMVEIVDTAAYKSVAEINVGGRPYRVRFTPDGRTVICTMIATKELLFIDAATRKETGRMKLESVPLGIAFSNDGKTAFVTVVQPDAVIKVDLDKKTVTGRVETGIAPDGIAVFGV